MPQEPQPPTLAEQFPPNEQPPTDSTWLASWLGEWVHWEWVHKAVAMLVVFVVATLIYTALTRLLRAAAQANKGFAQLEPVIARLLRWFSLPIIVLLVLQQAGVDLGNMWTVISAGLAMVAIGFVAVWSVLSNISAAFMIITTRLFRIGDCIEVMEPVANEGLRGRVLDSNLVFTTLAHEEVDGSRSITKIPNNLFFQKAIRIHPATTALPTQPTATPKAETAHHSD